MPQTERRLRQNIEPLVTQTCPSITRQLTIKQIAELDAYVRGRFIKNTIDAIDGLDESVRESVRRQIIPHMVIAAQQLTWIDKAATIIFETEENGMVYYTYKHVENTYPGDFNSWKERFNANREENMRLFFATRYVLTFTAAEALNPRTLKQCTK